MNKGLYVVLAILIMSAVVIALRLSPLVLFRNGKMPKWLDYLGRVLPYAMIPILLMYCVKDTDWHFAGSVVPMLIGVTATALVHIWKKNMMVSLIVGLSVYMVLLRVVPWPAYY